MTESFGITHSIRTIAGKTVASSAKPCPLLPLRPPECCRPARWRRSARWFSPAASGIAERDLGGCVAQEALEAATQPARRLGTVAAQLDAAPQRHAEEVREDGLRCTG